MNPPAADTTATTTFVVHFWREWTGAEPRWRGRVEHVQSGRRADFLAVEDLLGYFQRFGIGVVSPPAGRSAVNENRSMGKPEPSDSP
jgi:hypothetical protein